MKSSVGVAMVSVFNTINSGAIALAFETATREPADTDLLEDTEVTAGFPTAGLTVLCTVGF